jgi:excisionase family DNA binding protein
MIIDDKVMTLREVSEYLKVHPSTIYRQLKRGLIPAFKVGSDWRFNIESIDRWRLGQDKPRMDDGIAWSSTAR